MNPKGENLDPRRIDVGILICSYFGASDDWEEGVATMLVGLAGLLLLWDYNRPYSKSMKH